jgi:glucosamine 6-phosphate synthetase-like amidotransferase/phosphosugar isomerase protein
MMPNPYDSLREHPQIVALKARAKAMKETDPSLKTCHCIEFLARQQGFNTYAALRASLKLKEITGV